MEHFKSKDKWCVYYHKSRTSGKIYIGITNNTKGRWSWQGRQYSGSPHFWKAIQKYGWDDFDHQLLFANLDQQQAKMIEIHLIEKFDLRNPDKGYNIAKGGSTGSGLEGESHPRSQIVYQYSWNGDFIKEWTNASVVEKEIGIPQGDISKVKSGLVKQAGGYQWSFEKVDKMPPYTGVPHGIKAKYPRIYRVGFDGKLEKIYNDLHNIENFTRSEYDRVRQCCYGRGLSAFGSFWFFEPDYNQETVQELIKRKFEPKKPANCKKVCVYNMSGKLIQTFPDSEAASKYTGVITTSIRHACNSKNMYHHMKGYLFYFYDETYGKDVEPWKNGRLKPVLRFHDGVFVEKLPYLRVAINKYGSSIQYAVKAKSHYSYGDIWIYEDEYPAIKDQLGLEELDLEKLA